MDVYGVVGDPVDHSRSPTLFTTAFEAAGDRAVYGAFHVAPGALPTAIRGAEALGVAGLNVTAPHKETVLDLVSTTPTAAAIGAVNHVTFAAEGPVGHNTDAEAMRRILEAVAPEPGRALVLGAGGAARAYVYALTEAGWTVTVANRTIERAERLASAFAAATARPLDAAADELASVSAVVNATPVGQGDPTARPVATDGLGPSHLVVDAVYRPPWTRLLREASAAGADVVPGSRLLLEQAAAGYARWRGRSAPVSAMRVALDASLRPRRPFKGPPGEGPAQ